MAQTERRSEKATGYDSLRTPRSRVRASGKCPLCERAVVFGQQHRYTPRGGQEIEICGSCYARKGLACAKCHKELTTDNVQTLWADGSYELLCIECFNRHGVTKRT